MNYDVVINGRVLGKPLNGIPRYVMEICKELDRCEKLSFKTAIVVPEGTVFSYSFVNIDIVYLPDKKMWDYVCAEKYAQNNDALYINLAGKGVLYKKSISVIHDIRPLILGDKTISLKSLRTRIKFNISYVLALKNSIKLITPSNFTKNEICAYSGPLDITVIGEGGEHMKDIVEDMSVFEDYFTIRKGQYYLSVSSLAPHKNFRWIIENAKFNPYNQYVIVGKTDPALWKDETGDFVGNMIYLGYQSDRRLKALLKYAKALIFPSLYEGFGIPPLEAMNCRTPVIVSDIPVMKEIFGKSVAYIDSNDPYVTVEQLINVSDNQQRKDVLEKYTWKNATKMWIEIIEEVLDNEKAYTHDLGKDTVSE